MEEASSRNPRDLSAGRVNWAFHGAFYLIDKDGVWLTKEHEISVWEAIGTNRNVACMLYGGYDDCDVASLAFVPNLRYLMFSFEGTASVRAFSMLGGLSQISKLSFVHSDWLSKAHFEALNKSRVAHIDFFGLSRLGYDDFLALNSIKSLRKVSVGACPDAVRGDLIRALGENERIEVVED